MAMSPEASAKLTDLAHRYIEKTVATWLDMPGMPGTVQQRALVLAQTMLAHGTAQMSELAGGYNCAEFMRDAADALERGPKPPAMPIN
jgi:hypothetical protein